MRHTLVLLQNSSMHNAVPDQHDSLEALVAVLSPLFEERCYKGGAYLAREGQAADSLIYIEEGEADICFSMRQRPDEDLLDDEEEVCVSVLVPHSSSDVAKQAAAQHALCAIAAEARTLWRMTLSRRCHPTWSWHVSIMGKCRG